jgi:hypothetical protein
MTALAPLTAERGRVFRHRNYVDVAIDLPTGVEEEAVLEAILGQVTRVTELLAGLDTTGATNDGVPVDDLDGDPSDSGDTDEGGEPEEARRHQHEPCSTCFEPSRKGTARAVSAARGTLIAGCTQCGSVSQQWVLARSATAGDEVRTPTTGAV